MAWEISITNEGWEEIRTELENWSKEDLVEAIAHARATDMQARAKNNIEFNENQYDALEDELYDLPSDPTQIKKDMEALKDSIKTNESFLEPEYYDDYVKKQTEELSKDIIAHDILVDEAFSWIEHKNTCSNGGWEYYIDAEGYYTVEPKSASMSPQ